MLVFIVTYRSISLFQKGRCKISRSQQNKVIHQASAENQAYNTEAQTSFDTTNKAIGDYAGAVGKFRAANPYVQGGQAQTLEDQQLSDTAAGMAESAGQA